MSRLFYASGLPKTSQTGGVKFRKEGLRSEQLASILKTIEPDKILRHIFPKPKLCSKGWIPFTSEYTDTITKHRFRVLIDHILVSQNIPFSDPIIWNPDLKGVSNIIKGLKTELKKASDHYPVSVTITI